ncbi:MAG: 30S ribosomal protein S7 [Candidatus Marinimicrobia bacterium]|nr:30S ribosomal protein S7 [Candidatus Neomarinimicrobiota bacterium]
MRRRKAEKREVRPDTKFGHPILGRLVVTVMRCGKRSVAERVIYTTLDELNRKTNEDPLKVFEQALENVKPRLEVKSRRVGGATYQVPLEVPAERQVSLALRWIVQYANARKGMGLSRALAMELLDAYNNTGNSVKKRDDTYKMAQANKAFAHYRW